MKTEIVCGRLVQFPNLDDAQEVFDYVLTRLYQQKVRSVGGNSSSCLYRVSNKYQPTKACAAGWCIRDDDFVKMYEGKLVSHLSGLFDPSVPATSVLISLQSWHDNFELHYSRLKGDSWLSWDHDSLKQLRIIAERNNLHTFVVDDIERMERDKQLDKELEEYVYPHPLKYHASNP